MPEILPTSIKLSGELADRVRRRAGEAPASATIRRDLERYYRLVDLADAGVAGDALTLDQGLALVGERPLRRRSAARRARS